MSTVDVPQANDLYSVRAVVTAVGRGADTGAKVSSFTGRSSRLVGYHLSAAVLLGFVELDGKVIRILPDGWRLLNCPVGSTHERDVLADAVNGCEIVKRVAPDLLTPTPPSLAAISESIMRETGLSNTTATLRARCLIHWHRKLMRPTK